MTQPLAPMPGFRPLYRQVRDLLVDRLVAGFWKPGDLLPSEFQLAGELGVSQGTVRKALDEMTAENLLVRRQGRGTYVAEHDQEHALFHFFKMTDARGAPLVPESRVLRRSGGPAKATEAERLEIARGDPVFRIVRLRSYAGKPAIFERIAVPAAIFPGLDARRELPNTLYTLFARDYGVTMARAEERLTAVAAGADVAKHLDIEAGAPLLAIDRVALALDRRPVEWRLSLCDTRDQVYSVVLA